MLYHSGHAVRLNWLRGFVGRDWTGLSQDLPVPGDHSRGEIVDYLGNLHMEEAARDLSDFGGILTAASKLRSDSNYEALLIAHEYNHPLVSGAFTKLAIVMSQAAERGWSLSITAHRAYVLHDSDLEDNRNAYWSLLRDYLSERVRPAIQEKLEGSEHLITKLDHLLRSIAVDGPAENYDHLQAYVSLQRFLRKRVLMTDFDYGVHDLEMALNRET